MKQLLLKLYLWWSLLVFTITMLVLIPFMFVPYFFGVRIGSHVSYFFMRWWAFSFMFPNGGFRFKVYGRENLDPNETYIYCANHNSFLDTPAIVWSIKRTLKPLGKVEMTKVPIFGFIYKYLVVLVDRKSVESRRRSMKEMQERLNEGISVLIFPEGHMNKTDDLLQPFYDGAFRIAVDTQKPVVPIVVKNSKALLPPVAGLKIRPGTIEIHILKPIPTAGMKAAQVAGLKDDVRTIILDNLTTS